MECHGGDLTGGHGTPACDTEEDIGLIADNLWSIVNDCEGWRALRPIAGQAVQ